MTVLRNSPQTGCSGPGGTARAPYWVQGVRRTMSSRLLPPLPQARAWGLIFFNLDSKTDHGLNILKCDPGLSRPSAKTAAHADRRRFIWDSKISLPPSPLSPCPSCLLLPIFSPALKPFTLYLQQWSHQPLILFLCFPKLYIYCNLSATEHFKLLTTLSNRIG